MFNEMIEFLDEAYAVKQDIVPCLIGGIGIGKTSAVLQHAKNVGANKVVTMICSQIPPTEVSGFNMPDSETRMMHVYDSAKLGELEDGDILFLDELFEADQMVLSACLTLIESRQMMSGKMLPDIQIVAATNATLPAMAIKPSIRNRFMFHSFDFSTNDVANFIEKDCGVRPSGGLLSKLCGDDDHYNILSPRSLTKLCRWVASTDIHNRAKVIEMIKNMWGILIGNELDEMFVEDLREEYVRCVMGKEIKDSGIEFKENSSIKEVLDNIKDSNEELFAELLSKMKKLKIPTSATEMCEVINKKEEEKKVKWSEEEQEYDKEFDF